MNRYYTFLYTSDEFNHTSEFNIEGIQYLNLCKGHIVINYNHMIPIEGYKHSLNNVEIKTNRMSGKFGKYIDMPLNECYYSLDFCYSPDKKEFFLSDSSFLQLCSKNGNSCMECVRYIIKNP